ncbi:pirin family protein [Pararhodonellum marinum]|uniref:pirin family protein n=1 Tax=Pararhodonellum marinum TaxID=2755358 RepID=UPI00188E54B1|nr:pirin family protein [Pararhodonellum marinum]
MSQNAILKIKAIGQHWETQDPFLFCAYHRDVFPKGNDNMEPSVSLSGRNIGQDFGGKDGWSMYHGSKVPGFPAHPHKGFETVTLVEEGLVDHSDGLGAAGRFGNGDVQWMTAGKGLMHAEMFPLLDTKKENPLLLFQIWLNLPRAKKEVEPHFKMLWSEGIPILESRDDKGKISRIKIISGALNETQGPQPAPDSWAADPDNQVAIWKINMDPGASFTIPASQAGINRSLFYYDGGSCSIAGEELEAGHGLDFNPTSPITLVNGEKPSAFIFLQAKPIGEPVVQHGPFVMNSPQEIQKAVHDFQRTQFGGWPWPNYENVHGREKGRFAIHADGRLEEKA